MKEHNMKPILFSSLPMLVGCLCMSVALPQAPPTIDQTLQSKGTGLSIESLRKALQDTRPEVRGLAANALAGRQDKQSLPLIHQAFAKATSPLERMNMAQALITLDDPEGRPALRSVCEDTNARANLRLAAAAKLVDLKDDSCINAIPDILSVADDPSTRLYAMKLLISANPKSLKSSGKLRVGLEKSLQDPDPNVRQAASRCLVFYRVPTANRLLASAIAKEPDASTRLKLESDLKELNNAPH